MKLASAKLERFGRSSPIASFLRSADQPRNQLTPGFLLPAFYLSHKADPAKESPPLAVANALALGKVPYRWSD